jgi:SNF2 family DNA or RNA helicase
MQYHWGATGTLIGDTPDDLWPVYHAIDKSEFPVKGKFVNRYCLTSWSMGGGMDIVGLHPNTRDEFYRILDPRYRRMLIQRVLPQLPPKVRTTRTVEMTTAQARMYNEMEKKLMTRTEKGELLLAPDSLLAQTRLMQLSGATVDVQKPDPNNIESWHFMLKEPAPKLDEMERVLEELGNAQCVIGMEYMELIHLASARLTRLGIPHGFLTGEQSEYERDGYLQLLQNKQIRVLLFTLKAGGEGINMDFVPNMILLQRSWRMITDLQSVARVYRFGSVIHSMVNIVDIITAGTVEEEQVNRLYQKAARLEEIQRDRAQLIQAGLDTAYLDHEYNHIANSYLGVP